MVCYYAVTHLKAKFGYDDSLDVFGVHGMGSTVGMMMLGFLASAQANPAIATTFQKNGQTASLAGGLGQVSNQIIGILCTVLLSGVMTFIILQIVKATVGLRVSDEEEFVGLDLTEHGERAYND
jgi:Amt family ammonium transporter